MKKTAKKVTKPLEAGTIILMTLVLFGPSDRKKKSKKK